MALQQLQQQQQHQYLTYSEMLKSVDEFYECWREFIEFDESMKEEQRKEYFRKIFKELATRFIDKKIKPGPPLGYC